MRCPAAVRCRFSRREPPARSFERCRRFSPMALPVRGPSPRRDSTAASAQIPRLPCRPFRPGVALPRTAWWETRPGRSRWMQRTPPWRARWASSSLSTDGAYLLDVSVGTEAANAVNAGSTQQLLRSITDRNDVARRRLDEKRHRAGGNDGVLLGVDLVVPLDVLEIVEVVHHQTVRLPQRPLRRVGGEVESLEPRAVAEMEARNRIERGG